MERHVASASVRTSRAISVAAFTCAVGVLVGAIDPRLAGLVLVPAIWLLARAARLAVLVDDAGLEIRNPWRTHVVTWADIRDVRWHDTESKESFRLPVLKVPGRWSRIRLWGLATPGWRLWRRHGPDPAAVAAVEAVLLGWSARHDIAFRG